MGKFQFFNDKFIASIQLFNTRQYDYEDGELGRLQDIKMWWILKSFSKDISRSSETDGFSFFFTELYNLNNPNDMIEPDMIAERVKKLTLSVNKPEKAELVHFFNGQEVSRKRYAKMSGISQSSIDKHLDNYNPFKYHVEYSKDFDMFIEWMHKKISEVHLSFKNSGKWMGPKQYKEFLEKTNVHVTKDKKVIRLDGMSADEIEKIKKL